jgi:opacity protein-like surface antigen
MRIPFPLLLAWLVPCGVVAQQAQPRFEITPLVGFATGGSLDDDFDGTSFDVADDDIAGLALHITSVTGGQYEFSYWREDTSLESPQLFIPGNGLDVTIDYFQVGGTFPADFTDGFHPYVVATIGASRWEPKQSGFDDETFFAGTIGAGLRYNMNDKLALKLEGRAFANFLDSNSSVFCFSSGGGGCIIASSGDLVTRWAAVAGIAYRF